MAKKYDRKYKEIQLCVNFLRNKKHIKSERIVEIIDQHYFVSATRMYQVVCMNLNFELDIKNASAAYHTIMNSKYDDINIHTTD